MTYKTGDTITYTIGEHTYTTPPIPKHKEILFHDKKKADQYWVRQTDLPREFYEWHDDPTPSGHGVELDAKKTDRHDNKQLLSLDKEMTALLFDKKIENGREGLQEREHRRCKSGVWFYNNGEPTYITGNHYAILQWLAMHQCDNSVEPGSSYGQYYQFQRDIAYYFEICKTVEYARGGLLIKPKKTGMTQFFSLICLNEAMTNREKNIRMMSITETLCRESNFGFVKYGIQKVPNILMPSRSKQNEGEVIFGAPNSSRNPLSKKRKTEVDYLNTWLCTVPTARTSFDTFTNFIALIDEFPKIKENTYPKLLFQATLPTVIEGGKRKGTIFGLSYVPEVTDQSFYESREIFKESKLKTRQRDKDTGEPFGDTASKLICHTLVVQEGLFNCCDIYGKPILDKVWGWVNKELGETNGDPNKIQTVKRLYPTNEGDPWGEGSREDTLFDNFRIGQKIEQLEEMRSYGTFPYDDFNLEYEKEPIKDPFSERYTFDGRIRVGFVTHAQKMAGAALGRFKWFHKEWTPDWFLEKYINKRIVDPKTKRLRPNPESPFFISMDPTSYRIRKNTGKASLNAFQVFILPSTELNSAIGKNVTNRRLMVSYLYRGDKPSDTLADMIKLILLFNCMVQIESNMSMWATKLIEMGLGHFVFMVNKDGALEPWKEYDDTQNYFTSQKREIDMYVSAGAEFLGTPLAPGDIDNIDYLDDIDVLKQLQLIKKENTTEYDAAVAYLEGLMGIEAWLGWRRANEKKSASDPALRQVAFGILR